MASSISPSRACVGAALSLVAGCGTANQPAPPEPPFLAVASVSRVGTAGDNEVRRPPNGGFIAEGTPPPGTPLCPIPEGVVGTNRAQRLVPSFWMDRRRVRVGEYRACVAAGVCSPEIDAGCSSGQHPTDDDAIICTTWDQAGEYCAWAKRRLPTDDEWERAIQQHERFGLEEMGGLGEWSSSYYCDEAIGGCGYSRVVRGYFAAKERSRSAPADRSSFVGFRCVWSERSPSPGPVPPALGPVSATTPGAIACNTATCDIATEACCLDQLDGIGACVTRGGYCGVAAFLATCDESADCKGNELCCLRADESSGLAPRQVCQPAPCDRGTEACLPGGNCAAGFRCSIGWLGRHGRCTWQDVGARCGAKRCAGTTPVCCWDEQRNAGECSASACALDKSRFACSSPQDCGELPCVAAAFGGLAGRDPDPGFECGPVIDRVTSALCRTLKDCPVRSTGERPKTCKHTPELPSGVKRCVYVGEP